MKPTHFFRLLAGIALATGLASTAVAQQPGQTNYQWSAAGDKATWNQASNWTQGAVPPTDGTTYAIDLAINSGTSLVPINIGATDVVNIIDSLFGPIWGQTLNIYGSVTCGFGEFVWGDMNAGTTTINVQTNAYLSLNNTLALGTAWWFAGGPNVVMNVRSNAFVGTGWLHNGARLNIFKGGTVSVTNDLTTGTATGPVFAGGVDNDTTRSINLEFGAKLILPPAFTTPVTNWIARGILWVYGSPAGTSQIVIDETTLPGRTIVTTTATGPNVMTAVRIQAPRTNLVVGGLQQALVFADFTASTNVNVTSTATNLTYLSTAPSVITVAANGQIRAVGPGTATVRAIIGSLSNSVSITVSAWTNSTSMVHRYSFSETDGSTAADSVGGTSGDATIYNSALFNAGQLELNGVDGYASFPAGLLTNLNAVTIETWVTLGAIGNWAVMFTFGDNDGASGHHYISFQPHTGFVPATAQAGIRDGSAEQNPFFTPVLDNYTNLHLVCVYHPEAGYLSVYTNGVQAAINPNITVTLKDAFATGSPFNYLGRSQWINDPALAMLMNEFRIYNGPLSPGQIKANSLLGPNQLVGANTSVSLTATVSGNNIILTWPTTSALVTLLSSPVLGTAAVWTPVSAGSLVIDGGNYKWTVPQSGAAQFFRLQK